MRVGEVRLPVRPPIGLEPFRRDLHGVPDDPLKARLVQHRGLLSHNRALVPACGYYEWQGEGREKTPYYIHPRSELFVAFAGLYDTWTTPDGDELYTFTIITTDADEYLAKLHNRMPVILARELEEAWLDPELREKECGRRYQQTVDVTIRTSRLVVSLSPFPCCTASLNPDNLPVRSLPNGSGIVCWVISTTIQGEGRPWPRFWNAPR